MTIKMKTSSKPFALFILFLVPSMLFAHTIKGKVMDKTDAIPFANISITNDENKIITGATSDENGLFVIDIEAGSYKLIVNLIGYTNFEKSISIDSSLDLGIIILEENILSLNEVVIKSERRRIERKIDRLVFYVEESIASTGGNGLDVLKITPGIQVQNGSLEILGKGVSKVMINGRISPLEGEELTSFLSGLSASDILKIEVITNPPAKYEASGNGGLINIILKKGVQDSWKNSTTLSYNQNRYNFTTITNNFFYNKNKLSFSGSVNGTKGSAENLEGILINYPSNDWDIDLVSEIGKDQFSGRFLIDYALSGKTTVGLQYLGNATNPNIMGTTTSSIYNLNGALDKILVNKGDNIVDNKNHSLNFHALTKLDSVGKNITFDADYFTFNSENRRDFFTEQFSNLGISEGVNSAALNISNQEIENFSSKIDMELPLNKINFSFGVKASFTKSNSDVLYYDKLSGAAILDSNIVNEFDYQEDVFAGYVSGSSNLSDKLKMQFGLRLEDTKTKGINADMNEETINKYTKFFPTLYFSYESNDNNSFGFSYGRRISRPNFRTLNPFRFYINSNSYSVGNPFLQPSFSDNFEITHIFKKTFNTSIFINITTDGSGTIFTSDAVEQTQIITRENYFKQFNYGLTESFSFDKISWFKSDNSINLLGYYTQFTKDFGAEPKNGMQIYLTSKNTFSLSEKTKLQVNSYYSSQHNRGLYSVGEMFDLSLGLQHSLRNNLKVSLLVSDIFNSASLNNYISTVAGIQQIYRQNESSRNARLSLSYDFGNKKIKVKNRNFGNDAEQKRSN